MMNLKLCYFSFFVLVYEWISTDLVEAEKVIGLDTGSLDDDDTEVGVVQKRFVQRAIDPLMRRSPLDKNFMRFGKRSEDKGHQDEPELDEIINMTPSDYKLIADDSEPKAKRVKQDFIRLGRGKQDFIRFGRGKQDFIRFGRGKQDFIRFGRGKQDFIRFGRGDASNLLHYPETNYDLEVAEDDFRNADDLAERDPRAKNSFIRFGRAENFIRFGRNAEVGTPSDNINYRSKRSGDEFRFARAGDPLPALFVADVNPVEIRRSSGFIRLGRAKATGSKEPEMGDRRKRSLDDVDSSTPEPKVVPKIGFKGLVVVPPGSEGGVEPEPEMDGSENGSRNETEDGYSTEMNDFPVTEPPEKNFHIPSIRHKRRTYEDYRPRDLAMLNNNVYDALAGSADCSPMVRLGPSLSKDYVVKVG
nr:PREDICTED: uncharacterized protein LOC109032308 [Bemisia tabaci]